MLGGEAETWYLYVLASSSPSLLGAEEEEASVRARIREAQHFSYAAWLATGNSFADWLQDGCRAQLAAECHSA